MTTIVLCVFCLSAGAWISIQVHRREQRLSGSARAVVPGLAVDAAVPGPDRSTSFRDRKRDASRQHDLDARIRRALGGGKPRTRKARP